MTPLYTRKKCHRRITRLMNGSRSVPVRMAHINDDVKIQPYRYRIRKKEKGFDDFYLARRRRQHVVKRQIYAHVRILNTIITILPKSPLPPSKKNQSRAPQAPYIDSCKTFEKGATTLPSLQKIPPFPPKIPPSRHLPPRAPQNQPPKNKSINGIEILTPFIPPTAPL